MRSLDTPDPKERSARRRPRGRARLLAAGALWGAAAMATPVANDAGARQAAPAPTGQPQQTAPSPEGPAPGEAQVYELRIEECIERALRSNLDIALRRLSPEVAAAQVVQEEAVFDSSFRFLGATNQQSEPTASTLGGASVVTDRAHSLEMSFNDPLPIGGSYKLFVRGLRDETNSLFASVNPSFNSEWQVAFTQPLLKNFGLGANKTRLVVARNNHQMSQSDFRQTVIDTLSGVEKAYWELAFRILDLDVKKQSLQLAEDLLRLNRTKVQVGTLAPIEITQAEAGVADREEGVIVAQNEIHKAEDQLKRLLGPPSDPLWGYALKPVEEPPFDESLPDLEQSLAEAMKNRPDVEKSRLTILSREAQFGQAANQRRMDLNLDAFYGAKGLAGEQFQCVDPSGNPVFSDASGNLIFTSAQCVSPNTPVILRTSFEDAARQAREREADSWRVALTLNVPVGNRDAASRYVQARLAREQSEIDRKILEQTVTVEVRQAVREIETDIKRVKAARVNSRLQKEKLDAEQKKFENGISTSFNVLIFQEDLSQARSRENLALTDYNKSRVDLGRVLGTLPQALSITLEPGE